MSDTKDLYSRITIYTATATDDCYSAGEVITTAEAYSVDIDHQVQISVIAETDIDNEVNIYESYAVDLDHQVQIYENDLSDIDHQVQICFTDLSEIDEQIYLAGKTRLFASGVVELPSWHDSLYAEGDVVNRFDIDHQVQIYSVPDETDIDHQVNIYENDEVDIDHQVNIYSVPDETDIDHQVKIVKPIPTTTSFLVYEPDEPMAYDYADGIETIGIIRRYLDKSFGILQVADVSVVCDNSKKTHTYLHPDGDFYLSSKYIWVWARITCGWGVDLDQNVQPQFQGLIATIELTEERKCNFIIVDVIKELLDGKLAVQTIFDQNLVDITSLKSLNPIHIVEYLINAVLGIQVYDFDTDTFVPACDPTSFDTAYAACSAYTVNDTTWPADSSIITMIQDALKLVQGWIYTKGNGRIKAKVYPSVLPTGLEKHFIGSETRDDRKIMNFRLHPSRRDVINYIKWTYGQANNKYGPTLGVASIAQYGYRPLELSTGWEVDTSVLLNISAQLLFRYQQPPDVITFGTSNLYGSGDGLDAELGEVIKVTDDGIGIENRYFFIIEKRDDLLGRKSELVAEEYAAT